MKTMECQIPNDGSRASRIAKVRHKHGRKTGCPVCRLATRWDLEPLRGQIRGMFKVAAGGNVSDLKQFGDDKIAFLDKGSSCRDAVCNSWNDKCQKSFQAWLMNVVNECNEELNIGEQLKDGMVELYFKCWAGSEDLSRGVDV